MSTCLELVSTQFPLLRARVAWLFERDQLFRELCEDYATCSAALERQKGSQDLQREYSALRLRLETEMLQFLDDADEAPGARR